MSLRIGINALYLIPGGVGGTEIYARNLIAAMARVAGHHRFLVVTNRETTDLAAGAPNLEILPQPVPARIRPARILWEQTVLPALARRYRFDVLFNPGFTAPAVCPCPQVTVFHDLQHKRHPEYFRWFDLPFWTLLLWSSARRSSRLIAVSESTRDDLLRYYRSGSVVIPHGVEPAFFEAAGNRAPEPFILCVSTLHPHKGIHSLLAGFARFHRARPDFRLVLAGMRGFAAEAVEQRIRELGLARVVTITGWIPRANLIDLYRRAWAFVYPSTFEGFGMPVIEALAAGVPCACSDIEPLRSLCAGAAELFPPADEDAIAASLERITTSAPLRARLVSQGRIRSSAFSWESTARATLQVLEAASKPAARS